MRNSIFIRRLEGAFRFGIPYENTYKFVLSIGKKKNPTYEEAKEVKWLLATICPKYRNYHFQSNGINDKTVGIHRTEYTTKGEKRKSWIASYIHPETLKKNKKEFSIAEFGEEKAYNLAKKFRRESENKMIKIIDDQYESYLRYLYLRESENNLPPVIKNIMKHFEQKTLKGLLKFLEKRVKEKLNEV